MRFIVSFLLLLLLHDGTAQPINTTKLDSLFSLLEGKNKFMGSVALYKDGKLLYTNAVGYADGVNGPKPDKDTRYRIGSITKTFTSVLVLQAVEKGRLLLDDTLSKWYPQVNNAGQITIRQMLTHQSGIANFTNSPAYLKWNTIPQSKEEMVSRIVKEGSSFPPGQKFEYSNSAYFLLGMILEKVNKVSYQKLLEKNIFRPAKLKHTAYGGKIDPSKNECRSFQFDSTWIVSEETDMSVAFSAGAIISTPSDICQFADWLFSGNALSEKSLKEMQTMKGNVGMGLFAIPFYTRKGYGHTGGIDEFRTVYSYFPDGKVSYALFSNGSSFNNNDITIAVLKAAYGLDFSLPDLSVKILPEEELKKYLGVYASEQIPIKITFTSKNGRLVSQGTGQPAFELDPSGTNIFVLERFGISLEFLPEKGQLVLKQSGQVFLFSKEK